MLLLFVFTIYIVYCLYWLLKFFKIENDIWTVFPSLHRNSQYTRAFVHV